MAVTSEKLDSTEQQQPSKAGSVSVSAPPTGRRLAFQDLKRELTEKELSNTGTQKLMLDMLINAESDRDEYKTYVAKFHEADKRSCILEEKQKNNTTNEILFGVGVGLGGTIIGLAPLFWANGAQGGITLAIGLALMLGAAIGRIRYK